MNEARFSILIPSWNNLEYLRCCIGSIRKNSSFHHQIIVHVNEGIDGTIEYLVKENIEYTYTAVNVGVCKALNMAYTLAREEYILYMNDDMYVLPDWDEFIFREIKSIGHPLFYISATMMEPRPTGNPCVISPTEFGTTVSDFQEEKLLKSYLNFQHQDWSGATWPPSVVHRDLWESVHGYSEEFSPGLYSDPDFSMKLWMAGVRIFKGVGKSRVYHFQSKSLGRVQLNNGRRQFARKWKLPASYFRRVILQTGKPFKGPLPEIKRGLVYWFQKLKASRV